MCYQHSQNHFRIIPASLTKTKTKTKSKSICLATKTKTNVFKLKLKANGITKTTLIVCKFALWVQGCPAQY